MKTERHDFLVELGTEELPPKALRGLELAFTAGIRSGLEKAALTHDDIVSYATAKCSTAPPSQVGRASTSRT